VTKENKDKKEKSFENDWKTLSTETLEMTNSNRMIDKILTNDYRISRKAKWLKLLVGAVLKTKENVSFVIVRKINEKQQLC
jgi:hypothetical protein